MGRMKEELLMRDRPELIGGKKDDTGKPDISLIPYVALVHEARAFEDGQRKYSRYNFMQGFEVTRLAAACMRHVMKYLWENTFDSDSGVHHLGHARACLAMILALEANGNLTDNRYEDAKHVTNNPADRPVSYPTV